MPSLPFGPSGSGDYTVIVDGTGRFFARFGRAHSAISAICHALATSFLRAWRVSRKLPCHDTTCAVTWRQMLAHIECQITVCRHSFEFPCPPEIAGMQDKDCSQLRWRRDRSFGLSPLSSQVIRIHDKHLHRLRIGAEPGFSAASSKEGIDQRRRLYRHRVPATRRRDGGSWPRPAPHLGHHRGRRRAGSPAAPGRRPAGPDRRGRRRHQVRRSNSSPGRSLRIWMPVIAAPLHILFAFSSQNFDVYVNPVVSNRLN
jgi:hypothetical protein